MDPMDLKDFNLNFKTNQIIDILPNDKKTDYILNTNALKEILSPISDTEVVIISIAGPSRQGKSFLLSLMARYLENVGPGTDWMADRSQPLVGFEWKQSIDPQTNGIWLSKPFLVRQNSGKELAVLLMDTQGVFDEFANQRDWSTIVGLSLLSSSYLIFNVFNNLQEDVLTVLQSFLEYGLEAVGSSSGQTDEQRKPFQNLMFLIRDWNAPSIHKYGLNGGKDFLNRKLDTNTSRRQSIASQSARQLIRKCFDDISCFLMPDPGSTAKEDSNFRGRLSEMSDQFINILNELFINLLNPETMVTKTVDGTTITGKEFGRYLEVYVEAFNSETMPKPSDLIEATHKASDLNLINKLKDEYMSEIRIILSDKPYYSRKELNAENQSLNEALVAKYDMKKKSTNSEIVSEINGLLSKYLSSAFNQIYEENEYRRQQTANNLMEELLNDFKEHMNSEMGLKKFMNSSEFDKLTENMKKEIIDKFDIFCAEEPEIFAIFNEKLKNQIKSEETVLKAENRRLILEAETYYYNLINKLIAKYKQTIRSQIDSNGFLETEEFDRFDQQLGQTLEQELTDNSSFGDQVFINGFELDFSNRLSDIQKELLTLNNENKEKVVFKLKFQIKELMAKYSDKMTEYLDSIGSEDEIEECHQKLKRELVLELTNGMSFSDRFVEPFKEQLERLLDNSLFKFKESFAENLEKCENYCKNILNESKAEFQKQMESLFADSSKFYSNEEFKDLQNDITTLIIYEFNHKPRRGIVIEFEEYTKELETYISAETKKFEDRNEMKRELNTLGIENIRNKFVDKYEDEMEDYIKTVDSELEVKSKHIEIKDNLIKEFSDLNTNSTERNIFDSELEKLKQSIDKSLVEFIDVWRLEMENQKVLTDALIIDVRKWYKEEVNKHYQKTSFINSERLKQINERVIKQTIRHFESKRGNMSLNTFESLVQKNLNEMFVKVNEENDKNTPTLPAIGIDLGTTNSCVAYFQPRKPEGKVIIIENEIGRNTTPSVVEFTDTGAEVVGDAAKENAYANPRNTVFSAKRLIGRHFVDNEVQRDRSLWPFEVVDDGNNNPKIRVEVNGTEETYFAEQISAKVLKKLKEIAEKKLGLTVKNAVITVPAYFNDAQKEATKDAGTIAGLNVLKIINEPTAAAIAFQLDKRDDRNARKVLIFDFGGGTFDVAVLVIDKGNIEVKAVNGDNHLGGDDIDNNLIEYCLTEFQTETGILVDKNTPEGHRALRRLRLNCEKQKWQLSATDSTIISVDAFSGMTELRVELSREKFEELNEDLFMRSMDCVEQALSDAHFEHTDIDDIVLVGGSTRIHRIQELLSDLFGEKQLNHSVNADEAVAVGAAIQAAILNGNQAQTLGHILVKDVAPMSLGVRVRDGFMSTVIHRNSKVPNSYNRIYETSSDYQTEVEVEIFEGEDPMVANNRRLGTFNLSNIPSASAGEQKIDVSFHINDEAILNVSAKVISTGAQQEIEVTKHKGRLTEVELQAIIDQVK